MIYSLFLVPVWIGFVSCAEYHIIQSPNHCPVDACLTLSSFVVDANLYVDSNTSLIFHPGNHMMDSELNVTNVENFSMISYSTSAGIICDHSSLTTWFDHADFIFKAIDHVYFKQFELFWM